MSGDFSLTKEEEAFWLKRNDEIFQWVALSTTVWVVVHIIVVNAWRPKCFSWLSEKDQATWINDILAYIHAMYAVISGCYFFYVGEHEKVMGRAFGISSLYDIISTIGLGYFMYDVLFMLWNWKHYKGQIFTMGMHHFLFIYGFFLGRWYPCTLSPMLFHGFQITEISTLFLHKNWMMQKAKVDDWYVVKNGLMLIFFFGVRCLITYTMWWYAMTFAYEYRLYAYTLPYGMYIHTWGYYAVNVVGPCFMVFLNTKWYFLLIRRAMAHVKGGGGDKKAN